jgi:hypothetical protein
MSKYFNVSKLLESKYNKLESVDEPFVQEQCLCGLYTFEKPRLDYIFGSVFSIIPGEHIYPNEKDAGTLCIFKSDYGSNMYNIGVIQNLKKHFKKFKTDNIILINYYPCKNTKNLRKALFKELEHYKLNDCTYQGNLNKMISIVEYNIAMIDNNNNKSMIVKYEPNASLQNIDYYHHYYHC